MSYIKVGSASELIKALSVAKGGEEILLAPGHYDGIDIKGLDFDSGLTIKSASSSNMAVLSDISVLNSSGINFVGLEFLSTESAPLGTLTIKNSENISVQKSYVHGSLDDDPSNDADGIRIVSSNNVSVGNTDFEQLRIAIGHADSDDLSIFGNEIHDIRMDGIRGGGSSNVNIQDNYIHSFFRAYGDHADAIQFYTSSNNPNVKGIVVSGNIIEQGDGLVMQGIFLRNVEGATFYDVDISKNIIVGGNHNAIYVEGVNQLYVANNEVYSLGGVTSWIRIVDANGVKLIENEALKIIEDGVTKLSSVGNIVNGWFSGDIGTLLSAWREAYGNGGDSGDRPSQNEPSTLPSPSLPADRAIVAGNRDIQLEATAYDGKLTGAGAYQLIGNEHDNALYGNAGNNTLRGGAGADVLDGRDGSDVLDGGAGLDTASYAQAGRGVVVNLSLASPQNTRGAGIDQLTSIENLTGSRNADTLSGSGVANVIRGGAGDDEIFGDGGADVLEGGGGTDRFVYRSVEDSSGAVGRTDTILDFNPTKGDVIDLSAIDARLGGRDDAFVLVEAFSGRAGQLKVLNANDHYAVMGDVDGDGRAEIVITVYSSHPLNADSFML